MGDVSARLAYASSPENRKHEGYDDAFGGPTI